MENLAFISLFIIGLSYGATACMFSCMPFLAPLLINNSSTFKESTKIVLPFSLGRVFTYTIIAIVASSSSVLIKSILDDNEIFQILLGVFTISMGLIILLHLFKNKKSCGSSQSFETPKPKGIVSLFIIGALVSLNPCAPILTLIALSSNTAQISSAMLYGISFGLGAILVPFVFYTFFVGNIFRGLVEQFRNYANHIQVFASFLLIITGLAVISGKITL